MFSAKDYVCVCHGCGAFHVVRAEFLSVSQSVGFKGSREGITWSVPAYGCPECLQEKAEGRTGRIARAFDHGMAPESYARAVGQFDQVWERTLVNRANGRSL